MSDPIDQEIRILRAIFWSERDPEGRAFVPLADAYLRKGSPDEALSLLEDGLGRHPEFASAHMVAARAYRAVGARGSVHRALGSVLELDPRNASALRMKGELAESEGNLPVALTAFQEALERNPDYEDLPGRIERLALGMSAVEPTGSAPEGFDPSSLEASDGGFGDPAPADFDPIDDPHAHRLDAAERDVLPQVDELPRDPSGDGIERGSGVAGASAPFSVDSGPGDSDPVDSDLIDADLIDVDLVDAHLVDADLVDADLMGVDLMGVDLVDADLLGDEVSEADPEDPDFGIEDFPADERAAPADGVTLEGSVLGDERLELAPSPRGGEGRSDERRAGDLEAHEALAAEQGAGRSGEPRAPVDRSDPGPGDVDVIDPFGFDPLVAPEGTAASLPEVDASDGPAASPVDPDDDAPDWRLPSDTEGPRVSGVEPLPVTRTLGELYARQGLTSQAAGVFEALLERNPEDETLRARLSELRAGSPAPSAGPVAQPSPFADTADVPGSVDAVEVTDDDGAGGEVAPELAGFSAADQPIGSWFGDLLSWAPGAIPVEHLAPGAVPIESLAPVGWAADPVAMAEPVASPTAGFPEQASERASEPDRDPEPVQNPELEPDPDPGSGVDRAPLEPAGAEEALPAVAAMPPGRQIEPPVSSSPDPATPAEDERSQGASREDGFEGLDDFQDWLRSLDR